ncbi:hypothetical protein FHS59_004270 [Algoriphagus iocasae]|uniref:Uncharacterized protein n=1 Tax=Algoriphagus iocasae TaxID=1836499 RepID=A0A841MVJ9_9BACT|nr:hypothetical protein [Algoriphagus iocasae]
MKKYNKFTEHFLLPCNFCLLTFWGLLTFYWLDLLMTEPNFDLSILPCSVTILSTALLALSIKFRNSLFQAFCGILGIVSLAILF